MNELLQSVQLGCSVDPLLRWWTLSCQPYPALATVVQKNLSIPVTQAVSEKVFSIGDNHGNQDGAFASTAHRTTTFSSQERFPHGLPGKLIHVVCTTVVSGFPDPSVRGYLSPGACGQGYLMAPSGINKSGGCPQLERGTPFLSGPSGSLQSLQWCRS